jgi:hypothetical protein
MKTTVLIFSILIQFNFAFAQKEQSASKEIKDAISKDFDKWLVKTEFETSAEFEKRVKTQSDIQLKEITEMNVKLAKERYLNKLVDSFIGRMVGKLLKYNADDGTYTIQVQQELFVIKVPSKIAAVFKDKIWELGGCPKWGITIIPNDVVMLNDKWTLSDALIVFYVNCLHEDGFGGGLKIKKESNSVYCKSYNTNKSYSAKDLKKSNNDDNISDFYFYDWKLAEQQNYIPSNFQPISFTLEDLNITLPTISTNTQTASVTKTQVPDLDMNSIQTKNKNSNAFAVVIGNKDYQYTKNVSFAVNDAQTIKKYLINVLGYNDGNIFYLENASKSNFETYFGTKENPQGKLYNNIKEGISDVFIYYAGHGAPGLKDNKGYFVPIDCDPQYVEQGGYSLDLFYNNISKLNAKSITIVTDACFSGAEIFNNISSIIITVSNPIAVADNCVVLSSSTGTQVSSWYNDKKHGMFTYFFLKALQDNDKSDKNKDGKLSFKEIFEYVSDKTEGVPYYARSIHGVDQTPTIQGTGVSNIFIEYK